MLHWCKRSSFLTGQLKVWSAGIRRIYKQKWNMIKYVFISVYSTKYHCVFISVEWAFHKCRRSCCTATFLQSYWTNQTPTLLGEDATKLCTLWIQNKCWSLQILMLQLNISSDSIVHFMTVLHLLCLGTKNISCGAEKMTVKRGCRVDRCHALKWISNGFYPSCEVIRGLQKGTFLTLATWLVYEIDFNNILS